MLRKVSDYRTAVFDAETDPFTPGRVPQPFACAFLADDGTTIETWGDSCVAEIMARIAELSEPFLIYVHNGGRFDFHFLWDWIEEPVSIVRGRLTEFMMGWQPNGKPQHVWRDSMAILPIPLAELGDKGVIDYRLMEASRREAHKGTIMAYLRRDVRELLDAVVAFRERFEVGHTSRQHLPASIGQLAMRELQSFHEFERATEVSDGFLRQWYIGGRNQCFASGILAGPWQVFDVNGSYAAAMRDFDHPLTDSWEELTKPPRSKGVWFAHIDARNNQALPWRDRAHDDRIEFDIAQGTFFACSHELVPAMEAGMIEVTRWHSIWRPERTGSFGRFVDHWQGERDAARARGDKLGVQFAKLILASASGKFGQDPRGYREWSLLRDAFGSASYTAQSERLTAEHYEQESVVRQDPEDWLELWARRAPRSAMMGGFWNVGIAASITSASRAIMLDGLRAAEQPIYCDTDSVVCRAFEGPQHPTQLGRWKHEATAQYAAIAGRKTYCLFNRDTRGRVVPVKWASKGETLTPEEIIKMSKGGVIEKINAAPVFSVHGLPPFSSRKYKKTVDDDLVPF